MDSKASARRIDNPKGRPPPHCCTRPGRCRRGCAAQAHERPTRRPPPPRVARGRAGGVPAVRLRRTSAHRRWPPPLPPARRCATEHAAAAPRPGGGRLPARRAAGQPCRWPRTRLPHPCRGRSAAAAHDDGRRPVLRLAPTPPLPRVTLRLFVGRPLYLRLSFHAAFQVGMNANHHVFAEMLLR